MSLIKAFKLGFDPHLSELAFELFLHLSLELLRNLFSKLIPHLTLQLLPHNLFILLNKLFLELCSHFYFNLSSNLLSINLLLTRFLFKLCPDFSPQGKLSMLVSVLFSQSFCNFKLFPVLPFELLDSLICFHTLLSSLESHLLLRSSQLPFQLCNLVLVVSILCYFQQVN